MSNKGLHQLYLEHVGKVSDKWSLYLTEYDRLFKDFRDAHVRLLEIGIQNGGSLEIWSKYFTNASVLVGCDINSNCSRLAYDDARIEIVVGDANAAEVRDRIFRRTSNFDIVIEDGSHRSSDIIKSFGLYFPSIVEGGVFIAEDLHCSYWSDFEGGLFDPYSSISFFKRLADVVNHEHWGVQKARAEILRGIFKKYDCNIDAAVLSQVHSIEFINSMCVVRKASPAENCLGRRIIAGDVELVAPGHRRLNNKPYRLEENFDQSSNQWANRHMPPDEEMYYSEQNLADIRHQLASLSEAVAERDKQIAEANKAVAERDKQIADANQAVNDYARRLEGLYSSNSWRITKPFRVLSITTAKSRRFLGKFTPSKLRRALGWLKPHIVAVYHNPALFHRKLRSVWTGWRAGGVEEIIRRLHQSYIIRHGNESYPADAEVERQMQNLAALAKQTHVATSLRPCDVAIIVPVYRGLKQTRRCIESVLKSSNKSSYRLIIINDASPESEVEEYLNSLAGSSEQIAILHNPENLGFVETVNRGMNLAGKADVVLLNSDTEVANDWLDRMVVQAYSNERIGTVTPFSNNATICSYPDLAGWPALPPGETVERLDASFATANAGHSIELPTAVGFCMYIKRTCLEEIGLFDTETFGKGYGEENDFCLRAVQKGWRHILAADVFVFHEGEVSFSESAASKKANAMNIIRKLYPDYEHYVATHIASNAAYIYRLSATAARYRLDNRPVVLFITHSYGGGTEKHVQELAQKLNNENCRVLYLRSLPSINGFDATLESSDKCDRLNLRLTSQNIQLIAEVLRLFGVSVAHIHHTHGFSFDVESLLTLMRVQYDITIHDFYAICPRINFYIPGKGYCGTPSVEDCNNCLVKEPRVGNSTEIVWWRAKSASLLNGARNVYCPSQDTASRILNFFPAACVSVVPHEQVDISPTRYAGSSRKARRFALLGVLAEHKGLSYVESVLIEAECKKLAIEFVLIGYPQRSLNSKLFSQTGAYRDEDLQALIEQFDPDAILFPAQCPETYSYTLSAAIRSGRPLVVSDLGALPERVRDLGRGHVFSHSLPPAELASYLASIPLRRETEIASVA